MKRYSVLFFACLFTIMALPSLIRSEEVPSVRKGEENQGQTKPSWLALGLRSNYFQLQQSRSHIVGGLQALDEYQDYFPKNPLIQVNLSKYFAVELGMNQFRAMVLNDNFVRATSDVDISWTSFMLGLQFRWPHFHKSFVPYIVGGGSYNKNQIQNNGWYYYGFPDPATYNSWISQGNKPEDFPNNGYRRIHNVDDSYGVFLGLGADYFLTKHWAVNLDYRYHWSRANWTYILLNNDGVMRNTPATVSLDSWILGLGIKYFF